MDIRKTITDLVEIRAAELKALPLDSLYKCLDYMDGLNTKTIPGYEPPKIYNSLIHSLIEKAAIWMQIVIKLPPISSHHKQVTSSHEYKMCLNDAINATYDLQNELTAMLVQNKNSIGRTALFDTLIEKLTELKEDDTKDVNTCMALMANIFFKEGKIETLITNFLLWT